jgi:hypothetical protein
MTVDDIVKLVIAFSLSFSIVGISWQIMRFLNSVTNVVEDFRVIAYQVSGLIEKVLEDYNVITGKVFRIVVPLTNAVEEVVKPITASLRVLANFINSLIYHGKR